VVCSKVTDRERLSASQVNTQEFVLIDNEAVAREVSDLMVEFSGRLNASIALVRDHGSPEEFRVYREAVAKILVDMLVEVMNPLYARHPSLKPPGLK